VVAPFYEELARVLSLGRIGRAKRSQLEHLRVGSRVLYAGVGSGEDAAAAVAAGLDVTALDLSPRMLGRLERRLGRRERGTGDQASRIRFCCEDFRAHRDGPYDALALNFFLNVFGAHELETVLDHAVSLLRPGGRIAIADFAPPRSALERLLFELHYRPLLWASWALGLASLHPIYDYRARLAARGARVVAEQRFGVYESVVLELG
jgi:demethylmenaquinone methyltransferase/2-methoxy-6-polyprenyl-1,4-benzoquinol methylase